MQDIFALFTIDLGMITGNGFLMKNDIIVELAAQPGHILDQGGDLLVDDQEDVFPTPNTVLGLYFHPAPRFSNWLVT
jgi:hypothetical protein